MQENIYMSFHTLWSKMQYKFRVTPAPTLIKVIILPLTLHLGIWWGTKNDYVLKRKDCVYHVVKDWYFVLG